ncbi:MAG: hypothetical protein QM699_11730 [Amaricoccus sp.]|uniref:hypothetical protein n=1 Tax=Amaricoccus sp. TaxID=1872485 RepID=UPI0039E38D38
MSTRKDLEDAAAQMAEPLAAQVAALRADLAELGGHVAKIGKDRARGLKAAAGNTASEGYAKGEAAIDVLLAELQNLEDEVAEATRRRPFASLGMAALFGLLLGALFRR